MTLASWGSFSVGSFEAVFAICSCFMVYFTVIATIRNSLSTTASAGQVSQQGLTWLPLHEQVREGLLLSKSDLLAGFTSLCVCYAELSLCMTVGERSPSLSIHREPLDGAVHSQASGSPLSKPVKRLQRIHQNTARDGREMGARVFCGLTWELPSTAFATLHNKQAVVCRRVCSILLHSGEAVLTQFTARYC